MVSQSRIAGSQRLAPRLKRRARTPGVEAFEPRLLLASSAFLQGIVTISGTSQPQAGATILLHSLDSPPSIADQSTTTNAQGAYLFQNLPSGKYQITETPPAGYVNESAPTQPNSPLTPITPVSTSTIDVQLSDPSQLLLSYPTNNKETLTLTSNGLTQAGRVGQLNITVNEPDINYTTSLFPSFCVDFYRDIFTGESNLPYSLEPLNTGLTNDSHVKNPGNAGEIAYLYNYWLAHPSSTTAEAVGLQLAIWELEYETSGTFNVLNGSFFASGLTSTSPEVVDAQNFLTMAQGQNELAVYLNGLPTSTRPGGSQGLIAPESLDFTNLPTVSINGTDYLVSNTTPAGSLTTSTTGIPIPGTTVTLTGTDTFGNVVSQSTTTNTSGQYSFTGLNPSNSAGYTVTETPPASDTHLGQTSTTTGAVTTPAATPVVSNIVLSTNGATSTDNFFEIATVSINGVDFLDSNGDLIPQPGEPGIPGTAIVLTGTDMFGNTVSQSITTDSSGAYSFPGLNPSNSAGYTVTETPPAIYTHEGQTSTTAGAVTNTPPGTPSLVSKIVLTTNGATSTDNFAEIKPAPGPLPLSIGGVVFCDCSDDGIQQPSEVGIPGVTISLNGVDDLGNTVRASTTTNSQGDYSFTISTPGTYSIIESPPSGYFQGKPTAGTAGGTASGTVISNITLVAGANATGYNFSDISPSSLSGVVYYDLNHNGVMDSSDFGIAHVTVTLNGTNDLGQSVHMTTVTNDEGVYSFSGLRPGLYDLIRTQPSIFRIGKNTVGSLGGTVNTSSFTSISVPGCAGGANYLFGEYQNPNCRLDSLALHVGNVFYHFEQTYQRNPSGFAKVYPNLVSSISAGKVPWGKSPFPLAPVASYWVPTLGTKPIKIFPVHGIKYVPLISSAPGQPATVKVTHAPKTTSGAATAHTGQTHPTSVKVTLRK